MFRMDKVRWFVHNQKNSQTCRATILVTFWTHVTMLRDVRLTFLGSWEQGEASLCFEVARLKDRHCTVMVVHHDVKEWIMRTFSRCLS